MVTPEDFARTMEAIFDFHCGVWKHFQLKRETSVNKLDSEAAGIFMAATLILGCGDESGRQLPPAQGAAEIGTGQEPPGMGPIFGPESSALLGSLGPGESQELELSILISGRICSDGDDRAPAEYSEGASVLLERLPDGENFAVSLEGTGAQCLDGFRFEPERRGDWLFAQFVEFGDDPSRVFDFALLFGKSEEDVPQGRLSYMEAAGLDWQAGGLYVLVGEVYLDFAEEFPDSPDGAAPTQGALKTGPTAAIRRRR